MGKRILLADDSVTIHKVVELTFLDEDYAVEAVSNGDEAIARLAGDPPDLVIADVHMPPGPSGYEVCDKVREVHPGVPVLLLAGAFEAFDEERARLANAYLKKPFDSQRLLQTVQDLLAKGDQEPPAEPAAAEAEVAPAPAVAGPEAGASPDERLPEPLAAMEEEALASADGDAPRDGVAAAPAPSVGGPEAETAASQDAGAEAAAPSDHGLSAADIDAIARRVVELLGDDVVREVAWEVVPDLAEVVVKDRLRELEEPGD